MKILHVTASLSPEWGGPTEVVAGLTNALDHLGVECTVFAAAGTRVGTGCVPLGHVQVRSFRTTPLARFWLAHAAGLYQALRSNINDYALVHIHELWHFPHYAAYRAARAAGKPYVVTVHGALEPWAMRRGWLKKRLYMATIQRSILRQAGAVHALTRKEELQVRAHAPNAPVVVLPNGVRPEAFQRLPPEAALPRRQSDHAGNRRVLFLGRIHPKKGLDILAKAFGEIAQVHDDVRLVIAGPDEGGYRQEVEAELKAAHVLDKVHFTGKVTGEQKLAALATADCFVLPSYSEGFSMAVLEAMAYGVPVLITRQCNFPEVAKAGAGLVIEPSVDELSGALRTMLDNPVQLRTMGERGRRLVREHYTWDTIASRMIGVYERVLSQSHA